MKNSGCCPKCSSKDIARIPGWIGHYGSGSYLPLADSWWWPSNAKVSHHVCRQCGFVEQWVDSESDLKKIRRANPARVFEKSG